MQNRYNLEIFGNLYPFNELDLARSIEKIGLENTLKKCDGAFVVVLKNNENIYIAKDPLGQKPFYYGIIDNKLVYSDDLKQIRSNYKPAINYEVLPLYFRHGYIPSPYSIYKNIYKLGAGEIVTYDKNLNSKIAKYYSPFEMINSKFTGSIDEAVKRVEDLLIQSIDLPKASSFATLISGGVDSSLITALVQMHYGKKVDSFCAGFDDKKLDESHYAKAVATHLGTNHNEIIISAKDALNSIDDLVKIYPEPFADSSQIATHLIYKEIGKTTDFAFSGDGGDEIFWGYKRYEIASNIEKILFKKAVGKVAKSINFLNIPRLKKYENRLDLISDIFSLNSRAERYRFLISLFRNAEPLKEKIGELNYLLNTPSKEITDLEFQTMIQALDVENYLVDDGAIKVAFASEYSGVTNYAPILNSQVVQFAFSLPHRFKTYDGKGKYPLRKILYKYVPKELIEREKMGFGVPLNNWLKSGLKEWALDLIESRENFKENFDNALIKKLWSDHIEDRKDNSPYLWTILQLFAFLRNNE